MNFWKKRKLLSREKSLRLFNQITNVHYSTDFSSIDRIYPPFFIWDKNNTGQAEDFFKNNFQASSEYDLYIHFPYCRQKCAFCRHCSCVPENDSLLSAYLFDLEKEIELYGQYFSRPRIGHIYFGGGTPTIFDLKKVLKTLQENFELLPGYQFNVESTFTELDQEKLMLLKELGIKRLVLGVQSFDPLVLEQINRAQTREKFDEVYKSSRNLGIETINAELMGGLPGQTYESFMSDLNYLISLGLDSVHIYSYMQTPQTPLGQVGENIVNNDLKIRMIADGEKLLEENGYHFYGDDYSRERSDRNLSISRVNRLGVGKLSLGVSAVGFILGKTWEGLSYINTTDLEAYHKYLSAGKLPIEKYFFLDRDESQRALLIGNLRLFERSFLDEDLVKYLYNRYRKELALIKESCPVVDSQEKLQVKDWLIYSKYLYSPKVIKKCQKKIEQEYPWASEEIIM